MIRKIRRDDRGAAAIEYAIIGALIGIGLIGSLVSTKTSLSAIFGVAGSQMAAGTGTSAPAVAQRSVTPASSSSRATFWNGKTLASKVVTQSDATAKSTSFSYTDGTKGIYTETYDPQTGKIASETVAIVNTYNDSDVLTFTYGPTGAAQNLVWNDFYSGSSQLYILSNSAAASGWLETVKYYNTNGSLQSQNSSYTTSATVLNNAAGDEVYFRALSQ